MQPEPPVPSLRGLGLSAELGLQVDSGSRVERLESAGFGSVAG